MTDYIINIIFTCFNIYINVEKRFIYRIDIECNIYTYIYHFISYAIYKIFLIIRY